MEDFRFTEIYSKYDGDRCCFNSTSLCSLDFDTSHRAIYLWLWRCSADRCWLRSGREICAFRQSDRNFGVGYRRPCARWGYPRTSDWPHHRLQRCGGSFHRSLCFLDSRQPSPAALHKNLAPYLLALVFFSARYGTLSP